MDGSLSSLQELEGVVLRTISDWFDGPRGGLAEYRGSLGWFQVIDVEDEEDPWQYVLYSLTPDEVSREQARHELFRRHVGTHWDLDASGRRAGGGMINEKSEWALFYESDEGRRRPNYTDHVPIGWFKIGSLYGKPLGDASQARVRE